MKLAVCLPSRGTVYSQTIEEILRELKDFGADWQIYWSHARPIPECFNLVTEQALADKKVTHVWYVEEDMVLPKGILKHMMTEMTENNWEAVASDYPLIEVPSTTIYRDPYGAAYFSGCGCTLIKRSVFKHLKKPYWRSDIRWNLDIQADYLSVRPEWVKTGQSVYGFQDITFGLSLYLQGHPIMVSSMSCGQRILTKKGDKKSNQGHHIIKEYNDLNEIKVFQVDEDPNLVELYNIDDIEDRIHVTPQKAEEIIKLNNYKRFKPGQVIVDDSNNVWKEIKK